MEIHFTKLCLLFAVWYVIVADAKYCILPLPKFTIFPSLVLTLNGTLKTTESNVFQGNDFVRISGGEKVILSCAPNYFKSIESTFLESTCKGDQTLVVNDVDKNFLEDLSCQMRSIEEILTPVVGCDAKYTSVEFGYTNPITTKSHILGEACYNEELGKTIFVHIKSKSDFVNTEIGEVSVGLKDANHFKKNHTMSRYKIDFLMSSRIDTLNDRLTEVLGAKNVPEELNQNVFVGMNMLLNRQFYNILKLGWNYVIFNGLDTAPTLAVLESDILKLRSEKILDLYIGSNGVLKVLGKNGDTELFLKENRFPVPKYIWIGVRGENKFVGFAVINSPTDEIDMFFASKCEQITWLETLVLTTLIENRKIVCCEYQNFKNNIPEMPELTEKDESEFNVNHLSQ